MSKRKAKRSRPKKSEYKPWVRVVYFIIGLGLLSALLLYSVRWEALPIRVVGLGQDITPYALASGLVLLSIFGGTLIKSALYGRFELD